MGIGINKIGIYVPKNVKTNEDLSKIVDTTDEWIVSRTGIKTRYIADPGETTLDMALAASRKALENTDPNSIDLIVCSTVTPDFRFPSIAALVQKELNIPGIPAFDIGPACAGFIYVLTAAEAYIKSGFARKVLCITAERLSSITDWTDRNTCVLFGDAATAFVVEDSGQHKIIKTVFGGDGAFGDLLYAKETNGECFIRMDGTAVFKQAVRIMDEQIRNVCSQAGVNLEDIDLLVPHQANLRIIQAVGERLGLEKKAFVDVDKYANTSSCTIPLALADAETQGILKKDMLVATVALGGGFTWGAGLIRW